LLLIVKVIFVLFLLNFKVLIIDKFKLMFDLHLYYPT